MTWAKLDDGFDNNPKLLSVSKDARLLFVCLITWSRRNQTAGYVNLPQALSVARGQGIPRRVIDELTTIPDGYEHPLLEVVAAERYAIHDYETPNPLTSTERMRQKRQRDRLSTVTGDAETPSQVTGNTVTGDLARSARGLRTPARMDPEPVPVPVGEQTDKELSLVVQQHLSASNGGPLLPSSRQRVFGAWQLATGKLRAKLDSKRAALIDRALKAYPEDELIDAVRGWRHSPHHRGENDRATAYNDLGLLLRDAEHIEKFRDHERNGASGRVVAKSQSQQLGDSFRERAAALREQGS